MKTMTDVARNKFYVGSNSVFDRNWGHARIEDAIKQGQQILEKEFPDKDFVFVVKIVKVLKRAPRPVVVVDVR